MGRMKDLDIRLNGNKQPSHCAKCPARLKQIIGCCDWFEAWSGKAACTLPPGVNPMATKEETFKKWVENYHRDRDTLL